jgi:hypothetical protein
VNQVQLRDQMRAEAETITPGPPPTSAQFATVRRRRRRTALIVSAGVVACASIPIGYVYFAGTETSTTDSASDPTTAPSATASDPTTAPSAPTNVLNCPPGATQAMGTPDFFEPPRVSHTSAQALADSLLAPGERAVAQNSEAGTSQFALLRVDGTVRASVSLVYRDDWKTWIPSGARWCSGEDLDVGN